MVTRKTPITKRILSLLLAITLTISLPTFTLQSAPDPVPAAGNSKSDPIVFSETNPDYENFPAYPDAGSVSINKTARWIPYPGNDNLYARVDMKVNAMPRAEGSDIVLVLDKSGSMDNGDTSGNSPDLNPSHYKTVTFKKSLTYSVQVEGSTSYTKATDTLTMVAQIHTRGEAGDTKIVDYTISGYRTTHNGKPVVRYGPNLGASSKNWPADEWGGKYLVDSSKGYAGTQNKEVTSGLIALFKDAKDTTGKHSFPTDVKFIGVGSSDRAGWYDRSKGDFFRIDVTKEASETFVEQVLRFNTAPGQESVESDNRVSLITFSDSAQAYADGKFFRGEYYGDRETKTNVNRDDMDALHQGIKNIEAVGGTSYKSALEAAKAVIDARADKSRPVYVVFMSDGVPAVDGEYSDNAGNLAPSVQKAVDDLKGMDKVVVYSVGVGLVGAVQEKQIKEVSSDPSQYFESVQEGYELVKVFQVIANKILSAGKDAEITEVVKAPFTLVDNIPGFEWKVTNGGIEQDTSSLTKNGNSLTWNLGNIPREATLTFYIKIADGTASGNTYPTAEKSEIVYKNYKDNWVKQNFKPTELPYPGGSIRVIYYLVNNDGKPVAANGTELLDETRSTILSNGVILKDEFVKEAGSPILTLGKKYGAGYELTDFVENKTQFSLSKSRLKYVDDNYNNIGPTWGVTLSSLNDEYTVLAGYRPQLSYKVKHTYGANVEIESPLSATVGDNLSLYNIEPVNKNGFKYISANLVVKDIYGNEITNHKVNLTGDKVTGTMPFGYIEVEFVYEATTGLKYEINYYAQPEAGKRELYKNVKFTDGVFGDAIKYDQTIIPPGYEKPPTIFEGDLTVKDNAVLNVVYDRFDSKTDANYTIEYYAKTTLYKAVALKGPFGKTIEYDKTIIPPGYTTPPVVTGDTKIFEGAKMIVTYDKLAPEPGDVNYEINYYAEPEAGTKVLYKNVKFTKGIFGEPIVYDKTIVPPGYKAGTEVVSGDKTIFEGAVMNVTYSKFDPTTDANYTIEYYAEATLYKAVALKGPFGKKIEYDKTIVPSGYKGTPTVTGDTTVFEGAKMKVTYTEKDNGGKINYTINYYAQPSVGAEVLYKEVKFNDGIFGQPIVYDKAIVPPGYKAGTEVVTGDLTIFEGAVMDVTYTEKDPSTDANYAIEYYANNGTKETLFRRVDLKGAFGEPIVYDKTIIPTGYKGTPTVTGDETIFEGALMKVTYTEKDPNPDNQANYTIEYYAETTLYKSVALKGFFGDDIEYDKTIVPSGYKGTPTVTGDTTVFEGAKMKVTYTEKDNGGKINYTINYYAQPSVGAEVLYKEVKFNDGIFGQPIVYDKTIVPPGYKAGTEVVTGDLKIFEGAVMDVTYTEKDPSTDANYAIEYYANNGTKETLFRRVDLKGAFGEPIVYDKTIIPTGYKGTPTVTGDETIFEGALMKVTYTEKDPNPDNQANYTIEYYAETTLYKSVALKGFFGDDIEYDKTIVPSGYKGTPTVTGDTTVFEGAKMKVTYTEKDNGGKINYTINYYAQPSVGAEVLYKEVKFNDGIFGQPIVYDKTIVPPGYKAGTEVVTGDLTIFEGAVMDVTYTEKDPSTNANYAIEYYANNGTKETLFRRVDLKGAFGEPIVYDKTIIPTGYKGTPTVTGDETIFEGALMKVTYTEKDPNPDNQANYAIEYYANNGTKETLFKRVDLKGFFGDDINYDPTIVPTGYKGTPKVTGDKTVFEGALMKVTYTEKDTDPDNQANYAIEYYANNGTKETLFKRVDLKGFFGDNINYDPTIVPTGYKGTPAVTGDTTVFEGALMKVTYTEQDPNPDNQANYTIAYYAKTTLYKEVALKGFFGDNINYDATIIPPGYAAPPVLSGDRTVFEGARMVVTYDKLAPEQGDINYTINYYAQPSVGTRVLYKEVKFTKGVFGSPINYDATIIPPGYTTPPTIEGDLTQFEGAVMNVIYTRLDPSTDASYTIEYYGGTTLYKAVALKGPFGKTIEYDPTIIPPGYAKPPVVTGATTISEGAVMIVTYDKLSPNPGDVRYEINYYAEPEAGTRELYKNVKFTKGVFGEKIEYDATIIPPGYAAPPTIEGDETIFDGAIMNVIYSKFDPTTDADYTIAYYAKTTLYKEVALKGPFGKTINYDATIIPPGYAAPPVVTGDRTVFEGARMVVTYDKLAPEPGDVNYTINYYAQPSVGTRVLYKEVKFTKGVFGSPINYDATIIPPGYTTPPTIEGDLTVFEGAVMSVIYTRLDPSTDANYAIEYYADNGTDKTLYKAVALKGPFGKTIEYDPTIIPPGYEKPPVVTGDETIFEGAVMVVTYNKLAPELGDVRYEINYYAEPEAGTRELYKNVKFTKGIFGNAIEYDATIIPPGYTTPPTIEGDTKIFDGAVMNVIYTKLDPTTDANYTIEYYGGTTLYKEVELKGPFGKTIEYDKTIVPTGYTGTPVVTGDTKVFEGAKMVVTYTELVKNIPYTVNYYVDEVVPGKEWRTYNFTNGVFGAVVTNDPSVPVPEGHSPAVEFVGTRNTIGLTDNVFNFVFKSKLTYVYEVRYYKDYVTADSSNFIASVSGIGSYGDDIVVNKSLHAPAGYETEGKIQAGSATKIGLSNNIVYVIYEGSEVSYEVNYYKDSSISGEKFLTETRSGKVGTRIDVDLNANVPEGYLAPAKREGSLVVQPTGTVVNIVFTSKIDGLTYTINYYQESIDPDNLIGQDTKTAEFGAVIIPNKVKYSDDFHVTPGVATPSQLRVGLDPAQNVINVVYAFEEYNYKIEYYLDDSSAINKISTVNGKAKFNTVIKEDFIIANAPALPRGYDNDGFVETSAKIKTSNNVIKVVYSKINYGYTIEYYLDEVNTAVQPIAKTTMKGFYGDAITNLKLDAYTPAGYQTNAIYDGTLPAYVSDIASENIFRVYYKKLDDISYIVRYYKDSIEPANQLSADKENTGYAAYKEDVTSKVDTTKYMPSGYEFNSITNTIIELDPTLNIVKVLYTKSQFGYTVNYYKDSLSGELLGSDSFPAQFMDDLTVPGLIDLTKYAPVGYKVPGVRSGATQVTDVLANNVVNVVYADKLVYTYTINYYADKAIPGTELKVVTGTGSVGDNFRPTEAEIASNRPSTYKADYITTGMEVIDGITNPAVLNIIFTAPKGLATYEVVYYEENPDDPEYEVGRIGVQGTYYEGDEIVLDKDRLNLYIDLFIDDNICYVFDGEQVENPFVLSAGNNNEIKVVYKYKQETTLTIKHVLLDQSGNYLEELGINERGVFVGEVISDFSEYVYEPRPTDARLYRLVDAQPSYLELKEDSSENNVTLFYVVEASRRSIIIEQFMTDYEGTTAVDSDTAEVNLNEKVELNDFMLDGYENATITIVGVADETKPVAMAAFSAFEAADTTEEITEAVEADVVDVVKEIVENANGNEVIFETLETGLSEYEFVEGYTYTIIINYHNDEVSTENNVASEETVAEEVTVEETVAEEVTVEETVAEEVTVEETVAEEVTVEETATEEVTVEDTVVEEVTVEETATEEVTVEDTVVEDTVVEDTVTEEDTVVEDTVVEDTVTEEVTVEETVVEDTATEQE